MQTFTGFEYLMIDVANNFGLDKEIFDDRLQWVKDNFNDLETKADEADSKPLYLKAVQAIRKAVKGEPMGHLVGFDAICSGMQIMSVLTGDKKGALATGLVDPNERADAYTKCLELMRQYIPTLPAEERKNIKNAVMTVLYGSIKEPEKLFGKGSDELAVFYKAMYELAPKCMELLEVLRDSWDSQALSHQWKLPDGYDAVVKVMNKKKCKLEVDELDHLTFTYVYYENEAKEKGVSNVANVIHSVDAYLVRTLERRCNYDPEVINHAYNLVMNEEMRRAIGGMTTPSGLTVNYEKTIYYMEQYRRSTVADVVIAPYLDEVSVQLLSDTHLVRLHDLLEAMLQYKPFAVITVHDEFKCHPNNMNHLRQQYINILAELADSDLLSDLLTQVYKEPIQHTKEFTGLSKLIRKANYPIC